MLCLYVCIMAAAAFIFSQYVDRDSLQAAVKGTGQFGLALYVLVEIAYVTFTPLLNTFILIVSGYLFGGTVGFFVNFAATAIGLFLIVYLVKRYGRPLLRKLVSERFYDRFDRIVQTVGPITLLVVYVLPFTPDDELTYVIAAGPVGFKRFILPVILGTIAKSAYSFIGDQGAHGVTIAAYFRVILLIIGVIAVALQEYVIVKRRTKSVV